MRDELKTNWVAVAFFLTMIVVSLAALYAPVLPENSLWGSTEFWSAIVGSLVGGSVAFGVQAYFSNQSRKDQRQGLGYSLLLRTVRIERNLSIIHSYIENLVADSASRNEKEEPWQFAMPLANRVASVTYTADELALLLSLKDNDIFNLVLGLDESHNVILDLMEIVGTKREALIEKLSPTGGEGPIFTGIASPELYQSLRHQMFAVNGLFTEVRRLASEDALRAKSALDGLPRVLRERLHLTVTVEPRAPST